jgi:hypothetical protein
MNAQKSRMGLTGCAPTGGLRILLVAIVIGLEPASDRILGVQDRFRLGCAVGHAAREVRNGRKKAAAVLCGKRFDNDCIFWMLAHFALSVLQEGYQLLDVYRFNWPFRRDCEDFPPARFGHLVVGAAAARGVARCASIRADLYHMTNPPAALRVPGHLFEDGFQLVKRLFSIIKLAKRCRSADIMRHHCNLPRCPSFVERPEA